MRREATGLPCEASLGAHCWQMTLTHVTQNRKAWLFLLLTVAYLELIREPYYQLELS